MTTVKLAHNVHPLLRSRPFAARLEIRHDPQTERVGAVRRGHGDRGAPAGSNPTGSHEGMIAGELAYSRSRAVEIAVLHYALPRDKRNGRAALQPRKGKRRENQAKPRKESKP